MVALSWRDARAVHRRHRPGRARVAAAPDSPPATSVAVAHTGTSMSRTGHATSSTSTASADDAAGTRRPGRGVAPRRDRRHLRRRRDRRQGARSWARSRPARTPGGSSSSARWTSTATAPTPASTRTRPPSWPAIRCRSARTVPRRGRAVATAAVPHMTTWPWRTPLPDDRPVTILRPGAIYGPFDHPYVLREWYLVGKVARGERAAAAARTAARSCSTGWRSTASAVRSPRLSTRAPDGTWACNVADPIGLHLRRPRAAGGRAVRLGVGARAGRLGARATTPGTSATRCSPTPRGCARRWV